MKCWIRIHSSGFGPHWFSMLDPSFLGNADPDPDPGFLKKIYIFSQSFVILGLHTGEAFSPQKRTSSTSKREITSPFPILVSQCRDFCPPRSGSSRPEYMRIQTQNTSIKQYCGSGSGAFLTPGSGMGKKSGSGLG